MVIIYSTKTCGFCHAAKQYFDSHNIQYQDIDVGADPNGAQKLIDISGQLGVPVIDIDGSIVVGFNLPQINKFLAEKNLLPKHS